MIQSFAPGEVTPEQAMQIGEELCDRYLKGDYQYVIAVHNDKDHLHCHIIFNNTNLYNGLSFTTEQIRAESLKERGQSCVRFRTRYVLNTVYRSSTRRARAFPILNG